MIEYLERLFETGDWHNVLRYADELLRRNDSPPAVLLKIHLATLQARHELTDYPGAIVAGKSAVDLARALQSWDEFGEACINLGSAYGRLGHHSDALAQFMDYLGRLPQYDKAAKYEALAWFNLGKGQAAMGDLEMCCKSYLTAQSAAVRLGNTRLTHSIRMALLETYLRLGHLAPLPRLIAQGAAYIRNKAPLATRDQRKLYFLELRCRYALQTGRLRRAILLAIRGLETADSAPRHAAGFHLMLAEICASTGGLAEAIGHVASARIWAAHSNRPDIEAEALHFADKIREVQTSAEQEWGTAYLTT